MEKSFQKSLNDILTRVYEKFLVYNPCIYTQINLMILPFLVWKNFIVTVTNSISRAGCVRRWAKTTSANCLQSKNDK